MTLRVVASEHQLRVLKLSLQTTSRFGHEVSIEAHPDEVYLRSINTSKSVYAKNKFERSFFDEYELFDRPVVCASVLTKSLVAALRTHRICRAVIEVLLAVNKMVIFLDCENGLQKKFELELIDADVLNADVSAESLPVKILAEASEVSRLFSSFQASLDDVTLVAMPTSSSDPGGQKACQLHSFYDPAKVDMDSSLLHTQLSLNADQHFLDYQHFGREASDITFNLKDFRILLSFCVQTKSNIQLCFSRAGEPLLVRPVPSGSTLHGGLGGMASAEFVLATMLSSCVQSEEMGSQMINGRGAQASAGYAPGRAYPAPAAHGSVGSQSDAVNNTAGAARQLLRMTHLRDSGGANKGMPPRQPRVTAGEGRKGAGQNSGKRPPAPREAAKRRRAPQVAHPIESDASAAPAASHARDHVQASSQHIFSPTDDDDDPRALSWVVDEEASEGEGEVPATPPHERENDTSFVQDWS